MVKLLKLPKGYRFHYMHVGPNVLLMVIWTFGLTTWIAIQQVLAAT